MMEFDDSDFEEINDPDYDLSDIYGSAHPSNDVQFNTMIEGMSNSDYHNFGGLSSTKFPLIDLSVRAFDHRHLFDFSITCHFIILSHSS